MPTLDHIESYRIRPNPNDPRLSRLIQGVDQYGQSTETSVIEERPLTIYLNAQEIVTAMTIGDYPEHLAVGFLKNQGMLKSDDVIEVVDREKLARALAKEMVRQNRRLPCYIQVNTGEEPQKSGILPDQLDDFAHFCKEALALPIVGLMCIPPVDEEPAMHFALLNTMAQRLNLPKLSMGMSGDYIEAIGFGATSVRVGSAIFGVREN